MVACIVWAMSLPRSTMRLTRAYATERENKRRVKQLQVGQRIRVSELSPDPTSLLPRYVVDFGGMHPR